MRRRHRRAAFRIVIWGLISAAVGAGCRGCDPASADGGGAIVLRPGSPPPAEESRRMAAWHGRIYSPRLAPVFTGWRRTEDDLDHWRRRGDAPGCRSLAEAVAGVDRDGLLPTPSWPISRHLQELLWRLGQGADACLADRYFDARFELDEARRAWLALARLLTRYGLEPMPKASP